MEETNSDGTIKVIDILIEIMNELYAKNVGDIIIKIKELKENK